MVPEFMFINLHKPYTVAIWLYEVMWPILHFYCPTVYGLPVWEESCAAVLYQRNGHVIVCASFSYFLSEISWSVCFCSGYSVISCWLCAHTVTFGCVGLQRCKWESVCTVGSQVESCEVVHGLDRPRGMLFLCGVRPLILCSTRLYNCTVKELLLYCLTISKQNVQIHGFVLTM